MNRAKLLEMLGRDLPRVVALMGAGGKTTLLHALGDVLAARGERVVLTTTTHLGYEPQVCAPATPEELNRALEGQTGPVLAGYPAPSGQKLTGIPTDWYSGLAADHILVEADGSRGLPLKYHRSFEPVIPGDTGLLVELAGLSALDRPVWEVLHGWREAGLDPRKPVTEELMAALLLRGLEVSGFSGRALVVLNQGDTRTLEDRGGRIVDILNRQGVTACVTRLKEGPQC